MKTVKVQIGRTSGPVTDKQVECDVLPEEIPMLKDVLALVNHATNNKEGWYLRTGDTVIVPKVKTSRKIPPTL